LNNHDFYNFYPNNQTTKTHTGVWRSRGSSRERQAPAWHWLLGFLKASDTTAEPMLGVAKKGVLQMFAFQWIGFFLFVRKSVSPLVYSLIPISR
jgi:hypothetical protein